MEVLALPFKLLAQGIEELWKLLSTLGTTLIDALQELFRYLFIPEVDPFREVANKINDKFGFVFQISELFKNLLGFNNFGNTVPKFQIVAYGQNITLIDFSMFLEYRVWLHGIILAFAWFIFIRRTLTKLPNIIGGFSS